MFEAEKHSIEKTIIFALTTAGIPCKSIDWKPIPFNGEWGITTSFFSIAAGEVRQGKKVAIPQRAQEIAELIRTSIELPKGFLRVEAIKGYLNLYFDTNEYTRHVVEAVLKEGTLFGSGARSGKQIMLEFSHPNTHKAFHVGHLRGTILGDSICRILKYAGHDVIRANYPGDMGLHVIKWLWAYLKYHKGDKPGEDITKWMGEVYANAVKQLEANPEFEIEIRGIYSRWDHRDPEIVALWERTRDWSLAGFRQIYESLDVKFDTYYFNSQEETPGKNIVNELIEREIAIDERASGGAVIVKIDDLLGLSREQFRTAVILRSDGTALYATEDLALVKRKFTDYPDMEKSLYLVDVRQSLHFTQVFKILEIAGYENAKKCGHIAYELVTLPGNVVMSSREGTVVLLEDLLREAKARAKEEARKKNPLLSEEQLDQVSRAVGLGALKYPILARENTRMVTFDWQSALDFNGQAAPYIQYAHVRCNSILKKTGEPQEPIQNEFAYNLHAAEIQLIDLISRFPTEVQKAAVEYKPLIIATIAYDIAKAYASFYDACPVMQADAITRGSRVRLVKATMCVLANALNLLGIEAPEVM